MCIPGDAQAISSLTLACLSVVLLIVQIPVLYFNYWERRKRGIKREDDDSPDAQKGRYETHRCHNLIALFFTSLCLICLLIIYIVLLSWCDTLVYDLSAWQSRISLAAVIMSPVTAFLSLVVTVVGVQD